MLVVADTIKDTSAAAIGEFRRLGLTRAGQASLGKPAYGVGEPGRTRIPPGGATKVGQVALDIRPA